MKRQFRARAGFTLIEILISMVILMIGICGILGLFPIAIRNVNDSVQDTASSTLAQSLHSAMTEAMRRPVLGVVHLTHDGLPSGMLDFKLPVAVSVAEKYPMAGGGTDSTLEVYQLGTDVRTAAMVSDVQTPGSWSNGGDPTEPSRQYSFQFDVAKPAESVITVDTAGTTADLPLYQFHFTIFRSYSNLGPQQPVKEFTVLIAGSGN